MPKKACAKHEWKQLQRSSKFEKCVNCGTLFPCRGKCEHLDCCWVKGDEPPEYWKNLLEAMGLDFERQGLVPWKERK